MYQALHVRPALIVLKPETPFRKVIPEKIAKSSAIAQYKKIDRFIFIAFIRQI